MQTPEPKTLAEEVAALRALLPSKGTIDKRTASRIKPILEDLLEGFVVDTYKTRRTDTDFQGSVNIALLNAGVRDFFIFGTDFDLQAVENTLTVTAVWNFPDLKSSVIVDIFFSQPPTAHAS